jgi:hypothetical protein
MSAVLQPTNVPMDKPWARDFRFWAGGLSGAPILLADAEAWLKRVGVEEEAIHLTTGAGTIQVAANLAGPRVPADQLGALTRGAYAFELQATDLAGGLHQVRGLVTLTPGLGEAP